MCVCVSKKWLTQNFTLMSDDVTYTLWQMVDHRVYFWWSIQLFLIITNLGKIEKVEWENHIPIFPKMCQ